MIIITRKKYFRILALLLLVTTYLPVLTNNLPAYIRSHHLYALIWGISIVLLAPKVIQNRLMINMLSYTFLFAFLLQSVIWINVDSWNKSLLLNEAYMISIGVSMYIYFFEYRDYYGLSWLMRWTIVFIGITAIMSIYSSYIDPLYARKLVGGITDDLGVVLKYGGGSYGFAGAIMMILPLVIYYYRNNYKSNYSKPIILLFGILLYYALLRIQLFANILLSTIIIVIALIGERNIRKNIIFFGLLTVLTVALVPYMPQFLFYVSNFFETDSEVYFKINDLAVFIKYGADYGDTATSLRSARYPMLFEGFLTNPLLGIFNSDSTLNIEDGGHLYWMNKLTVYGLLGFIPFALAFYFFVKNALKIMDTEFSFYFLLSIGSGVVLGLMKSLAGREFWYMFFFVLPGLYWLPLLKGLQKSS